ncbi:MAG: transglutaminase domain-containing protein [Verrucomicrobiaceae bacterium]|nr:MAG: transglutaminase domain-containing protein [Verrucomicrobiaceae bacterium]
MTDRPLLGLVLALVVEARHWTRVRWDFDDDTCGRVWQFTTVGIVLAAVLIWLDGNRYTALPNTLSWLPALLMPMQFVQSYGLRDALPLNAFSFVAKRRRARKLRHGLSEEITFFNFGNVLFTTTLVAAAVGRKSDIWLFLPGLLILGGWMLRHLGCGRLLPLIPVLAVAGLLGLTGRFALEKAESLLGHAAGYQSGGFDPNHAATLIGTAGTVRQSADILWRLQPGEKKPPPRLLRTGTFNSFLGSNWRNQRLANEDFKDLDTRLIDGGAYYMLQDSAAFQAPSALPYFRLRGTAAAETPLPLPGDSAGLSGFELDGIERNSFGTVRVFPKHPVIDGTVFWKSASNPESPPIEEEDLKIPIAEREAIRRSNEQLGITRETPLGDQLARLRSYFHKDFRYTRQLTIRQPFYRAGAPTAINLFLTRSRAGHCEYFATAAVLMLRDGGIPARYATGYTLMERDVKHGGYIIRGTHGHAWCRVWDAAAGRWIDFDPTPPDWLAGVSGQPPWNQRLDDNVKRLREDFFLWRNRPANRLAATLVMLGVGLGLAGYVARRLWYSKRRLAAQGRAAGYTGAIVRTPLHELETRARKRLGERRPGEPFTRWLARLRPVFSNSTTLDEAIALHQRLRFDPAPPRASDQERLAQLAAELEAELKRS